MDCRTSSSGTCDEAMREGTEGLGEHMALEDCRTYTTSDGQTYIPLVISLNALDRVLSGQRRDHDHPIG